MLSYRTVKTKVALERSAKDILAVDKLTKHFGNLAAVSELSFTVEEGEILGMMGPNGAGKTTIFNLITGVYAPTRGEVIYHGKDVTNLSAAHRCRLGIGRTYQIPRPFEDMTVLENLLVGAQYGGQLKKREARTLCMEVLDFTGLFSKKDVFAGKLTLLDRKRLELARALATKPNLLLIDEVAAGLTEAEVEKLLEIGEVDPGERGHHYLGRTHTDDDEQGRRPSPRH